jgi:serine/threonine protein kinase/Tol biopolymer transport system component
MTNRTIGHYRVLEQIGAGAMGEVFRARDERLGRDVALKLIRPGSSSNPDHLRRFELEARAAAALNHPNIVAVYDIGVEDGSPYIVCELLEGMTLRNRLLEGKLPVRLAIDYAIQIVQGLIAAHDRRIVHRDLKPENLFVTTEGRVKILDFGVAKLQRAPDEAGRTVEDLTTVTKSGAVIGTVAYMSPEQLRSKPVDHRSDIFSVGAILYEMLSGRRAFRGETDVDTMTAVLREEPPEADLEQAGIAPPFQQVVRHCLEKDPEKRFQSARDLGFALETLSNPSAVRSGQLRIDEVRASVSPSSRWKVVPWIVAGALALMLMLFSNEVGFRQPPAPSYQRLTFEEGTVYSARFTPDFHSIVYGATWENQPLQLFSTVGDSVLTQPLSIKNASLLAISQRGELALTLGGSHMSHLAINHGTLGRSPLAGGSPREILQNVAWADWGPNDELAVVHHTDCCDQLEYPIGHALYQNHGGWISHIRLSPKGDRIAFINHATLYDDRGSICLIGTSGDLKILSGDFDSADGLAWSADGKEIWFTAAATGYTRSLMAVTIAGKMRNVLSIPAGLTLQDIAPDGRVLISVDTERLAMATYSPGGKTQDISWHDWDIAKEISQDGQSVLFEDASEAAPKDYAVALRKMDGTPPIFLGEGSAGGLSPDGKWAIGIIAGDPGRVNLYPVGPGQARTIPVTGVERIHNGTSHFLPDGKQITIDANEPHHGVRCYLVDIDSGNMRPITPEGVKGGLISPDGQYMIAKDDNMPTMYPIHGGPSHAVPGLEAGFVAVQWSEDNSSVYAYLSGQIPTKLYRINLTTGEKTFVQDLQPDKSAGLVNIAPVVVSRDGARFAFSYYQAFSVLYVVSGLR